MASKGNTWQKKLVERQRRYVRKVRGIKQAHAVDGYKSKEEYRTLAPGRAPKRYGSEASPR